MTWDARVLLLAIVLLALIGVCLGGGLYEVGSGDNVEGRAKPTGGRSGATGIDSSTFRGPEEE